MNIGYGQNDDNTIQVIKLINHDINTTSSLKLLGVIIDSNLNFSEHINTICKKASQKIGVLMRLRNSEVFNKNTDSSRLAVTAADKLQNCATCPYINDGVTQYTFLSTGETRTIKSHFTCNTKNLIYMIQCNRCNL